jgi:cytidyltransferase-like protein
MNKLAVYVGRFNPLHLSHMQVIETMNKKYSHSIVLIGSCNAPISIPNLFDYKQRHTMIRKLFPDQRIAGIPDYDSDELWLHHFNDILELVRKPFQDVICMGGSYEDIAFYEGKYETDIINRFTGETKVISATQVRDALIEKRSLDGLVHISLQEMVREMFNINWHTLRTKK